ncbi:MAG: family 78 glycoside hydrolase catalytic domain [Sphingomonas sp.]
MTAIDRRTFVALAGAGSLASPVAAREAIGRGACPRVRIEDLRVDRIVNPLGLEAPKPNFSWQLRSQDRGVRQSAYRIVAAASEEALERNADLLWDTGKVPSNRTSEIAYAGPALRSRQRIWWRVFAWDEAGKPMPPSDIAWWEMGLLDPQDWQADWLDAEDPSTRALRKVGLHWIWGENQIHDTPRHFRWTFDLEDTPAEAVFYLSAKDTLEELLLDGVTLAKPDAWLSWGAFSTFDVTHALSNGKHHAFAMRVSVRTDQPRPVIGGALTAMLRLKHRDGRVEWRVSSPDWRTTLAAMPAGWAATDFDDTAWRHAVPAKIVPETEPWPPAPAMLLRRDFTIAKPVRRARLYATALGGYEPRLNGAKVGDIAMTPEQTDYRIRTLYQVYDVTNQLTPGANTLGAIVGDGWFASAFGYLDLRYAFGPAPKRFIAQLEIDYEDGSSESVLTGDGWRGAEAPIRASDIFLGEDYDARLERPGWDAPGFDARDWAKAGNAPSPSCRLEAQPGPPIREVERLRAVAVRETRPGVFVFDFGQNFAGWTRLRVKGSAGTTVQLRFAELAKPSGDVDQSNLRRARAIDHYILRGDPDAEIHEPRFTYHGFRYVEVTGYPGTPTSDALEGVVVRSDLPITGQLKTSEPVIDRIWRNAMWSQCSNLFGIPTDCPQRDERMGWLGDAEIFWDTASFNMDVDAFTRKFMADVRAGQTKDGEFPDTAPFPTKGGGTPGWADGGVILPWTVYHRYGDTRIIEQNWRAMMAWSAYVRRINPGYRWTGDRGLDYGDWLALDAKEPGDPTTPKDLIGTAFWAHTTDLMIEMGAAIGADDDVRKLRALSANIHAAFRKAYVRPDGHVGNSSQTSQILALRFDLLPEALRRPAADVLAADIARRGGKLSTGFLGTPHILDALADNGHAKTAIQLLLRKEFPSWGYMVSQGATTMWERWNSDTSGTAMNSFNHYAFGAVVGFLYRRIAGISAAKPGFDEIAIRPLFQAPLDRAEGTYRSAKGTIRSNWRRVGARGFLLDVDIPANAVATVHLPALRTSTLREGHRDLTGRQDVRVISRSNDTVIVGIGSGQHRFAVDV